MTSSAPITPNSPANTQQLSLRQRLVYFAIWAGVVLLIFFKPVLNLVGTSLHNDNVSHTPLIPFISVYLIYIRRQFIFRRISSAPPLCAALTTAGLLFAAWAFFKLSFTSYADALSGYALAIGFLWAAGFALFFGLDSFRSATFPMAFLLLMVPLPDFFLDRVIYYLQSGSAAVAEGVFDLFRVPALRDGFVFHLAHVNIEVAKECSGIRSSLALLILALLVSNLFLRTFWKQGVFVVAGMVIMMIKNGVRIATLTILAQYVDPGFLYGRLHHEGGVVFFLFGLLLMLPLFMILERSEKSRPITTSSPAT